MMAGDDENGVKPHRPSSKALPSFNNYSKWKHKLRENCFKRVREDRTRLLWKFRLPDVEDQSANREEFELRLSLQDFIKSALHDIVSDELRKVKGSSVDKSLAPVLASVSDDMIWEYDGHPVDQGDCEEIILEMQRIFYEDLQREVDNTEHENYIQTWEDEEDDYLARAVYEHMQLKSDDKVSEEVWCPICKKEVLHENAHYIYCCRCELKLKRGQIDLNLLRSRLAEAHMEHLDRGCRLRPEFCLENKFGLTALYIKCKSCDTFEIVL